MSSEETGTKCKDHESDSDADLDDKIARLERELLMLKQQKALRKRKREVQKVQGSSKKKIMHP